jgi:signal peptidase I
MVSRRVPWRAALLSVLTTGLGQLYSGRLIRAIIINLLSTALTAIFLGAFFIPFKPWNILAPVAGLIFWWVFVLWDAARCARMAPPDYRLKAYNHGYIYLTLIALTGAGQQALKPFIEDRFVQAFKIPTRSMDPTLVVGDHLLVDKFIFAPQSGARAHLLPHRDPRRGDLVVFNLTYTFEQSEQHEKYFKRVIGLPGDHIRIVHRQVFVNGQPLDEPYVLHDPAQTEEIHPEDDFPPSDSGHLFGSTPSWDAEMGSMVKNGELIVPSGRYFVLGDNREQSWDSRFWGFVPRADIFGKADVIYFSWDAQAHRVRWDRIGEILR